MARKPKVIKTFHPSAVIASLEVQNYEINQLIVVVSTVLTLYGDKLPPQLKDQVSDQLEATRKAMWPEDE